MRYTISANDGAELTLNESNVVASVLQNVRIILTTIQGTVPMYRDFGLSRDHRGRAIHTVLPMLYADIREKVEKYEPRVRVDNVVIEQAENDGSIIPTVEVTILE